LLTRKLHQALKPIFETRIHRTTVQFRKNGSHIELAIDRGEVRAGQKIAPIYEVELELKRGKPAALFKLAQAIVELVPARVILKSKSERGYELLSGKQARAGRAQKIQFQRGTSTLQAFRIIAHSALRHIIANEPAVRALDPKGYIRCVSAFVGCAQPYRYSRSYSPTGKPNVLGPSSIGSPGSSGQRAISTFT
jgi:triphosphatase